MESEIPKNWFPRKKKGFHSREFLARKKTWFYITNLIAYYLSNIAVKR